jgi:hypothetical protein
LNSGGPVGHTVRVALTEVIAVVRLARFGIVPVVASDKNDKQ